jgi:hypothetical protein
MTISDPKDRVPIGRSPLLLKKQAALHDFEAQTTSTETLHRGIGMGFDHAPTLKSVRRWENLEAAFREVSRRAIGCDGFSYWAYQEPFKYARFNLNFQLAYPELQPLKTIQESLLYNAVPDAVLTKLVKGRPIQIGTVKNRIVERAFARKLTAHFDRYFAPASCAFRKGKSPELVASQIRSMIRQGARYALKTDIKQFFASTLRAILFKQLLDSVQDEELCTYVFEAISPYQLEERQWTTTGLPQGNGLSPVLSNLYLRRFDLACSHLKYRRFADDILVLANDRETLVEAQNHIALLLANLGLQLNEGKTDIYDLYRQSVVFLGYEIRGGNLYPSEKSIQRLGERLRIWGQRARQIPMVADISMVSIMKGFVRRFRVGPVYQTFRRIDRRLKQDYPEHTSLASLWKDREQRNVNRGMANTINSGLPRGVAAGCSAEKARVGQVPTVGKAAGEQVLVRTGSPAPIGTLDGH